MSGNEPEDPARPLYAKVRDALIEKIRTGAWSPGQMIPNEFDLAAEFGVSQGTARKAMDALAADGLVVRRQGRGTFVVEHTPSNVLFRFFNIFDDDGVQVQPDSPLARPTLGLATPAEAAALAIKPGDGVIRIDRVRTRGGTPFVVEAIVLSSALFPGLADRNAIPNTLYDLFQREFGIFVARGDEHITAVAASASDAVSLSVAVGAPLLRISRVAFGLDDKPVEWRVSTLHLDGVHYAVKLK
jgi:GntR family transcriptional regulator